MRSSKQILHTISILISTATVLSCGVRKDVYYARQAAKQKQEQSTSTDQVKDANRAAAYASKPKYVYTDHKAAKKKSPEVKKKSSSKSIPSTPAKHGFITPIHIDRKAFVKHALTYQGIPYVYGGTNPAKGLDCSGFVMNVFQHFGVTPPRSTSGYMDKGKEIPVHKVKEGDILLFTGSANEPGVVGHMGIVVETKPVLKFVHSASGKGIGVIVSEFKGYYVKHFIKAIEVLK